MMNKPLRILFMGTPPFAVTVLEALIAAGHTITCVFTQPDTPKGRGKKTLPTPVKVAAEAHGIPVHQPVDLNAEEWVDCIHRCQADLAVVAAYGRILPQSILDTLPGRFINTHASILPAYRGAAPIQWAVRNREKETGVTLMQMDASMDTGPTYATDTLPLAEDETTGSLFERLGQLAAEMLCRDLPAIAAGTLKAKPQEDHLATYAPAFSREDEAINWSLPAVELEALLRAFQPKPGCFTYLDGARLKILTARIHEDQCAQDAMPGTIIAIHKAYFTVQTGQGCLDIYDVQPPGKRRMSSRDFLNGTELTIGTCLANS